MATTTQRRPARASAPDENEQTQAPEEKVAPTEEAAVDPNHVLALDSVIKRPYITVDGERHVLRRMQDFGAIPHKEFSHHSDEYDALWAKDKLNRDDRKRYEWLLDWLFERVLVDPKALREQLAGDDPVTGEPQLTGWLKREVILTFSNAPVLTVLAQQIADQAKARDESSTTES